MTETGSPSAIEPAPGRTRLGAYALATDDEGRVLLARLAAIEVDAGAWTLPGGGVDFGEHPDAAVLRELEEETGYLGEIESLAGVFSHVYPHSRAADGADLHFLGILYRVRITGGVLRDELDGSTDTARWLSPAEMADLHLVEIARFGVDLALARAGEPA
jgi:8-oxo-dGTP pyrophosphatase MutT (NUDIX family)